MRWYLANAMSHRFALPCNTNQHKRTLVKFGYVPSPTILNAYEQPIHSRSDACSVTMLTVSSDNNSCEWNRHTLQELRYP